MSLPPKIKEWLNARGITDAVAEANRLDWNGSQLVIPIFDPSGKFLFNKYRRDPFGPTDIPKYRYEPGTTAQLFNAHKIINEQHIIICEGELDSMRLEAAGYCGVTSTGGASTSFRDEWISMLSGKELFICFDNDDAGMKGAAKLLTKLPAKLVVIPHQEGVKDVTDYLQKHTAEHFIALLLTAETFPVLSEPVPKFELMKDVDVFIKKYRRALDELLTKERIAKNNKQPFKHLDPIRNLLLNAIDNLGRERRRIHFAHLKKPADVPGNDGRFTNEDIARAKETPLTILFGGRLHVFGDHAVGNCPFHNEKIGSFTIYIKQNTFYCFGCSAGTDPIDFVMRRDSCDFIAAVKKLLNR